MENTPDEINNLAERGDYKEMVDDFKEKLRNFQQETKDPWHHKWECE